MTTKPQTRTYFAISIFSSRTFWFNAANFIVSALSITEVINLIPLRYLPVQAAVVSVINMWLRSITVRPAVFISPGSTVGVQVPKLDPPAASEA